METKPVKSCSTSYVIRETPLRTTSYHRTPRRVAKIQNTDDANVDEDVEQQELIHCCRECTTVQMTEPLRKAVWRFLVKLNILPPHNPAITPYLWRLCKLRRKNRSGSPVKQAGKKTVPTEAALLLVTSGPDARVRVSRQRKRSKNIRPWTGH